MKEITEHLFDDKLFLIAQDLARVVSRVFWALPCHPLRRYITADASGANLNPAVSIGLLVGKRITVERFFVYVVAQVRTTCFKGMVVQQLSMDVNVFSS